MNKKEYYKNTAVLLFDSMNKKDFTEITKRMSEDVQFDFPGVKMIEGIRKVSVFFGILLRKYSELIFEVQDIITENEKLCIIWTNSGKYMNGKEYKNSGMTLIHFKEDKIIFLSDYFKDTSFTEN